MWPFTNYTAMCTQAGMHIICLPECIFVACAVHSVLTPEFAEFSNKCAGPFGIYSKPTFKVAVCHIEGGLVLHKGWTPHLFQTFDFYNPGFRHCQVFGGTRVDVPLPPCNYHATRILHYCCNNTCLMSTAPATHTVCRSCAQAPMSDVNHALGFVVQQNGHRPTLHHVSVLHGLGSCWNLWKWQTHELKQPLVSNTTSAWAQWQVCRTTLAVSTHHASHAATLTWWCVFPLPAGHGAMRSWSAEQTMSIVCTQLPQSLHP